MWLRVAHRIPCTQAEGPARRYALWVQGCSIRCRGCCNADLFDPGGGPPLRTTQVATDIIAAHRTLDLDGLTLLGGEPLEQIAAVTDLCERIAGQGLGVIVFSGHTLEEAKELEGFDRLWRCIDTLVDGRYDPSQPEPPALAGGRRFIGSRNQRLHHRTERYADAALWRGSNSAEIQIDPDGTVTVHGFPSDVVEARRLLRR